LLTISTLSYTGNASVIVLMHISVTSSSNCVAWLRALHRRRRKFICQKGLQAVNAGYQTDMTVQTGWYFRYKVAVASINGTLILRLKCRLEGILASVY